MADRTYPIKYDSRLAKLFGILGVGPARSAVTIHGSVISVVMGWALRATIPTADIETAAPDSGRVTGWGVHGWRGRWLVNGSSSGLVRLTIEPPVRARLLGWPVQIRELRISLDDPATFLADLHVSSAR